jgi:rRNA maturation endonuclease Nob1
MSEVYMCTGCMQTIGDDEPYDYCTTCESHKYFAWVEEDDQ